MRTRKKNPHRKWPRGKALHNEFEIAATGNTVAAFPARAVTSDSNCNVKQALELVYSITEDRGLCC